MEGWEDNIQFGYALHSHTETWEKLYFFRNLNFKVRKFPQKCAICDIHKSKYTIMSR